MGRLCWKRLWLRGGSSGCTPLPPVLRKVLTTLELGSGSACKVFIVKSLFFISP